MKCHYEVLGVPKDADETAIKKSFRKLALQHHPDKNHGNEEASSKQMIVIQQAYDVLSDKHERAWYDRHREAILRGGLDGDYKDETLNLFPFFSPTCFSGFGDDDKGFYAVYRDVFAKLAAEDSEFTDGEDVAFPAFGDSTSDYDEVVGPFYAFWTSYSTLRSYAWLDEHDIRQAPNRFVVRQMEKENRKAREAGRRERNEGVRELAAFVRKRDRRVRAQRALLEAQKEEAKAKAHKHRIRQLRTHQEMVEASMTTDAGPSDAHKAALADIDSFWASDDEASSSSSSEGNLEDIPEDKEVENEEEVEKEDSLYCVACEKLFKTPGAMSSHLNSKKHKETLAKLKKVLKDEDLHLIQNLDINEAEEENRPRGKSKKQKRRQKAKAESEQEADETTEEAETPNEEVVEEVVVTEPSPVKEKIKPEKKPPEPKTGKCQTCGEEFPSRSRLFTHLEESGHAKIKTLPKAKNKGVNKRLKN